MEGHAAVSARSSGLSEEVTFNQRLECLNQVGLL